MEKEQFEEIRTFARQLSEKRQVLADGPLLDQCQQHLNALVEHLTDEFEEAAHLNAIAEPPHRAAPHHRKAPARKAHK